MGLRFVHEDQNPIGPNSVEPRRGTNLLSLVVLNPGSLFLEIEG